VLQVAGSLGPMPQKSLSRTFWNGGPSGPGEDPEFRPLRLMRDPEGTPVKAEDVTIGSVFHIMPEGLLPNPDDPEAEYLEKHGLEEKAKAAVLILIRLDEGPHRSQKQRDWGHQGIVAYSKICTHVGCPVGPVRAADPPPAVPLPPVDLRRHADCEVIFGPAKRPLPQLKITVDDEGYLVAAAGFAEACRPELLGAPDEHHHRPTRRRPARGGHPRRGRSLRSRPARRWHRRWVDDRTGAAKPVGYLMKKVFPDHWSFMLGEIAMYSMIICLLTGAFLTFWFVPSAGHTIPYDGSFVPLRGVGMSEAYASTLNISFDIKGGLIIRQIHHWAALMFIVALTVHMFRVFFTGAFRKPREINWVIGTVLALLAIVEGFAGYSLPDDLLSGTGIRAMAGFVQTAPVIGTYLVYGIFGGPFPGEMIIPRLYSVHILLLPAILIGLFTAHIGLVFVQKHTQYPGPGRTNENVVGFPVMPVYAAKAGGFFFIVFGVLAMISALVQINPVWAYGPYDPSPVTAGSQPDWYMGFADGALRLLPGWLEFEFWGYTLSLNIALGALVLLPLVYTVLGIYPFVERWVTKDDREHHLLDRPRNNPVPHRHRHGGHHRLLGLHVRRGQRHHGDQAALSINDITWFFRIGLFVLPPLMFWVTKRICLSLQRRDRDTVLHGRETGTIIRTPDGKYFERHEDIDAFERWPLVAFESPAPLALTDGADANGVSSKDAKKARRRVAWSNFYFKTRVEPVTPTELAAAHHHGEHEAISGGSAPAAIKHDKHPH
jgi:ubiquinol-cytochrome c reductase cytochrome b subunit